MPFEFRNSDLSGVFLITPKVFGDNRGFFLESFSRNQFAEAGIKDIFVQDNQSCSEKGVLRGLHFQRSPYAQGKLVRVVRGSVWDVAVDLRPESLSYKQWVGFELSEKNHRMLYIPPGFGHGFIALEDDTHFLYKCTNYYAPEYDGGVRWDDPELGVQWPLERITEVKVSEKDKKLPFLKDVNL